MNTKSSQEVTSISIETARKIVAPLYEALNEPSKKDVDDLLAKATNPDYRSYSTNSEWLSREQSLSDDPLKPAGCSLPTSTRR